MAPCRIVSLAEMLKVDMYKLVDGAAVLAQAREFLRICEQRKQAVKIGEPFAKLVDKAFERVAEVTAALNLPLSQDAAKRSQRLFEVFKKGEIQPGAAEIPMLVAAIRDFDKAVWDETSKRTFFSITIDEAALYSQDQELFGEKVSVKFAVVSSDIGESGKCFALGRYTACVFHLMRVMEFGIKCLAKKLKVEIEVEKETWYQIEQHVNKSISAMPNSTTAEQKKKQRYAAAVAGLSSVRIAWRNDVMHPKATYTEEEARRIMDHVGGFLNSLSPLI